MLGFLRQVSTLTRGTPAPLAGFLGRICFAGSGRYGSSSPTCHNDTTLKMTHAHRALPGSNSCLEVIGLFIVYSLELRNSSILVEKDIGIYSHVLTTTHAEKHRSTRRLVANRPYLSVHPLQVGIATDQSHPLAPTSGGKPPPPGSTRVCPPPHHLPGLDASAYNAQVRHFSRLSDTPRHRSTRPRLRGQAFESQHSGHFQLDAIRRRGHAQSRE